jgi:hypothetical protein
MIPKVGSITLSKQKRIRDMLERLSMRERPLRHGHRHDQKNVLSVLPFVNLIIEFNGFKGSYGCIYYLLFTIVPDDELDIDTLDGFSKGMHELHLKPQGKDPKCFCGDTCKVEMSGDNKTQW